MGKIVVRLADIEPERKEYRGILKVQLVANLNRLALPMSHSKPKGGSIVPIVINKEMLQP